MEYLGPKLVEQESLKRFKYVKQKRYGDGKTVEGTVNDADRILFIYFIIQRIKIANMTKTKQALPETEYSRIDDHETFIEFLKRHELFEEFDPLHHKSRLI